MTYIQSYSILFYIFPILYHLYYTIISYIYIIYISYILYVIYMFPYILYYIILYCIILYYIKLYYIILYYITLQYITLYVWAIHLRFGLVRRTGPLAACCEDEKICTIARSSSAKRLGKSFDLIVASIYASDNSKTII